MEVTTPREFFEKEQMQRFKPENAIGIEATIQFNITGENGGNWYLTIKDQTLTITEGVCENPKMTVTMKDTDFVAFVNRKITGQMAFMTGKLKFKGDMGIAMKLRPVLGLG